MLGCLLLHSPSERTEEDVDMIYEELMNVRACRHLSNAVSRSFVKSQTLRLLPEGYRHAR